MHFFSCFMIMIFSRALNDVNFDYRALTGGGLMFYVLQNLKNKMLLRHDFILSTHNVSVLH